jgi:DNA-binding NarL/FixJ family response regulator
MIRVLLVDDDALVRSGLRMMLAGATSLEVVAEAADGREVLGAVDLHRPDVVLMDIRMPGVDGLDATRQIAEAADLAHVHVLILTTFDHDEYVIEALGAGASGFVIKNTDPGQLLHGIRVVAGGEALLSPGLTRRLVARLVDRGPNRQVNAEALAQLTEREREVAGLAAYGMSNDEIAEHLVISPATAKTHVSRAMAKLGARDRAQLVALAYQHRLVDPPDPTSPTAP